MAACPNCGEDNADSAKFCSECGTQLQAQPAPAQEARKTVTVLFCDLVGSTALGERLDSESVREIMDRYFGEMRAVIERHGGVVEKYIGDAVMAVFGLPRSHEDDALRALRAASEMQQTLLSLNAQLERSWGVSVANRTGVNTGEVVIGDPSSGQRLATGDPVNVAARLEQAASTNHVLIGESTYVLVKDAVTVEAVEPLALKGKSERLRAFRLIEVKRVAETVARRLDAPLVGRDQELAQLLNAFERAVDRRTCHLVTVLGEAGVGKSRLVTEVALRLRQRATVLTGRCLSYGEGITFWPFAEMVRQAAHIRDEDSSERARRKLDDLLERDDEAVADRVASLVGMSATSYPIEESFWAARKLLETLTREGPVVVVFEDIHWAEAAFLDLVEHVVDLSRDPIFVICTGRSELRELRPDWSEDRPNASMLTLAPLPSDESGALIDNLLGGAVDPRVRARVGAAAQGNPLYLEQIISMWLDDATLRRDDGRWVVAERAATSIPPTISALLSARLDRLDGEERTVLAGASVIGQVFYRGGVCELSPPGVAPHVPTTLSVLTAKEFVRPDPSSLSSDQTFAFRHILIRDAAYGSMLKRTRAELHERFASWLERVTSERSTEYEETLGFHYEQAYRYHLELHPIGPAERAIAQRAAALLASAGSRALRRYDMAAASNLLSRAGALLERSDPLRLRVLAQLGEALTESGDLQRAENVLNECLEEVQASGDRRMEATAKLRLLELRRIAAPEGWTETMHHEIKGIIEVFENAGDDDALAKCWDLMAAAALVDTQAGAAEDATRKSAFYAQRSGDRHRQAVALAYLSCTALNGPMPVPQGIRRCEECLDRIHGFPYAEAIVLGDLGVLYAMQGRFELGRTTAERSIALFRELGATHDEIGTVATRLAKVDMLGGNIEQVTHYLSDVCRTLENMQERWVLPVAAAMLAQALYADGNYAESQHFASLSKVTTASKDAEGQISWRAIEAKLQARSSNCSSVRALVLDVTCLVGRTDSLRYLRAPDFVDLHAEALLDSAEALCVCGDVEDATDLASKAVRLFTEKGNVVSAARARMMLEQLSS